MILGVKGVDFPWVKFHESCYGEGEKTSEEKNKSMRVCVSLNFLNWIELTSEFG